MPEQTQREYWSSRVGDEWAANADRMDAQLWPVTEAALQRAAFHPGERVLDIGCGGGATSLEIARRVAPGGAVVGVDLSPQLLRVARERAAKAGLAAEFLEADAGAARFDPPFDAAFSRFGVMFFDDPVAAFAHIRGQMRAGGRLTFICWRPAAENVWATTPITALLPMFKTPPAPPDPDAPGPFAFANADKVRRVLSGAGWRDVQVAAWDGEMAVGGGGSLENAADFLLRIGPCARALAEQNLDVGEAKRRLMDHLAPLWKEGGVALAAACWIVSASA